MAKQNQPTNLDTHTHTHKLLFQNVENLKHKVSSLVCLFFFFFLSDFKIGVKYPARLGNLTNEQNGHSIQILWILGVTLCVHDFSENFKQLDVKY